MFILYISILKKKWVFLMIILLIINKVLLLFRQNITPKMTHILSVIKQDYKFVFDNIIIKYSKLPLKNNY